MTTEQDILSCAKSVSVKSMNELLSGLNQNQLRAVISTAPVILCLAGAGSGKTTILTRRIAHLFNEQRIGTTNMLALTFTRLAGKEMKERVIKLVGEEDGKQLFCNTFHAFAVSVLRRWGQTLGIDQNFTIYDQEDREEILKKIIVEFGSMTTLHRVLERHEHCGDYREEQQKHPEECRVLLEYGYRCKQSNAVDLDRLIDLVIRLWELRPEALLEYQQRYTHVFVDEYQDTSDDQERMLQLLNPQNLFVVGDDFQAIYGWRRARVEYILNFPERYPECEVIKLEDNYRSTEQIVSAANRLIKNNIHQTEKKLIAHKSGIEVITFHADHAGHEAMNIAEAIRDLHDRRNVPYKEIALLARTNNQVDTLLRHAEQKDIPCQRVAGKDDPYKAPAIRPIMNWMAFLYNKKDDMAVKKVIRNRVTDMQLNELEFKAKRTDSSLFEVVYTDSGFEWFRQAIDRIEDAISTTGAYTPGMHFKIIQLETETGNTSTRDLVEVEQAIAVWENSKRELGESDTVKSFLKYLRYRDVQEKLIEDRDAVKGMTVHASKGLEFDTVFIAGMNQGVFPSKRGDIEEERRLFYVALTRAKNRLYITHPLIMAAWNGMPVEALPSQFLNEIR
jgi:DNA helicase-2/ATP-dependent DNA helicase PcrA